MINIPNPYGAFTAVDLLDALAPAVPEGELAKFKQWRAIIAKRETERLAVERAARGARHAPLGLAGSFGRPQVIC